MAISHRDCIVSRLEWSSRRYTMFLTDQTETYRTESLLWRFKARRIVAWI
jgi:hypothetical protein